MGPQRCLQRSLKHDIDLKHVIDTVNSRYNGSEGTNKFYALLADCVIAKMTILTYLLCYLLCFILGI